MKYYVCPKYPDSCETAMKCRLSDPDSMCPYCKKPMKKDCCKSMCHDPPTRPYGSKGHVKEMRELLKNSPLGKED